MSAITLLATLMAATRTDDAALADQARTARGYAYGIAQQGPGEDELQPAPEVEAEVPSPNNATLKGQSQFHEEQLVGILESHTPGGVVVSRVRADACIQPGIQAKLQETANRAEYLENGGTGANAPAERTEVSTPPGFPASDACLTPTVAGRDSPSGRPSASPTPTPTPSASPTPTPTPSASPTPPPPNCEQVTAGSTSLKCLATLPLWNARAYTRTVKILTFEDLESEALARCEDDPSTPGTREVLFSTAVKYGTSGNLVANKERPNQNLNPQGLGLSNSAVVTFWETNWDPRTNSTRDGSDTVWVNALHIQTPTQDIVIGHAEATATCPEPTPTSTPTPDPTVTVTVAGSPAPGGGPAPSSSPPPGGYPRDVDLEASRSNLRWGSALTFSGSVTPDAQFETPRVCVENVPVTIRRDIVGGAEEFADMGTVRTDDAGQFSFNYTADIGANWVAFIEKDIPKDCAQAASEPQTVLVAKRPLLQISDTSVRKGEIVRFTISFMPCEGHEGAPVGLLQAIGGRSALVKAKKTDSECTAVISRRMRKSGSYQALARKTDEDHLAGKSRQKAVIVNGRRP